MTTARPFSESALLTTAACSRQSCLKGHPLAEREVRQGVTKVHSTTKTRNTLGKSLAGSHTQGPSGPASCFPQMPTSGLWEVPKQEDALQRMAQHGHHSWLPAEHKDCSCKRHPAITHHDGDKAEMVHTTQRGRQAHDLTSTRKQTYLKPTPPKTRCEFQAGESPGMLFSPTIRRIFEAGEGSNSDPEADDTGGVLICLPRSNVQCTGSWIA